MSKSKLAQFDNADEVRKFPNGLFEIVHINEDLSLARATYQPGWKWSEHNAQQAGTSLCHAPHTGAVLSGHGVVLYETGERLDLLPGTAFHIDSTPHDSWVEGTEPYVSLHVLPRAKP